MRSSLFVAISLIIMTASVTVQASTEKGHCYDQAVKYKNLMHKQVLVDLDSDKDVKIGAEVLDYTQDRYALDNFEEIFVFTIPVGTTEGGLTNLVYTVTIETWINTDNEAFICDVLSFSHEKTF